MLRTFRGTLTEYRMLHYWVEKHLGKPRLCDECGTVTAKRYEWANISGKYKKILSDWRRLCKSCHQLFDYGKKCKRGLHPMTADNIYIIPSTGVRQCLSCKKLRRKEQYQNFKLGKVLA